MTFVDTHAHIYHEDETLYPKKSDPLLPPKNKGTIEHLKQDVADNGIGRVVLVQTGSAYLWDNRLLADTAKANAGWAVGVCTLDPTSEDSVVELERLVGGFNVKGLRVEPTKTSPAIYDQAGAHRLWQKAQELGVVICAHIQSEFTRELANLLKAYPKVPVVLDHSAYPKAAEGVDSETVKRVIDLAEFENLNVKLTFAVTGSDDAYPFGDMKGIVRKMVDTFGADRCMWGSGFPCELWLKKATYAQHLALVREDWGLSEGEQAAVLEETPMRIWFGG
ncbi:MAG: amidohydrolase [Candidatus Latescibacteria bacterium]|nr:amidohydrolase [Candidatus Latescibacterota bacterium]